MAIHSAEAGRSMNLYTGQMVQLMIDMPYTGVIFHLRVWDGTVLSLNFVECTRAVGYESPPKQQ